MVTSDAYSRLLPVAIAGIAVLGLLGTLHAAGVGPDAFNLDGEYTVPALWSAGLLLGAAGFSLALSRGQSLRDRNALLLVACFMGFLALDEVFSFHERIDARTGIDWQVLFLPAIIPVGWAFWRAAGCLRQAERGERLLFAGLAAWVVAQTLEAFAFADLTPGLVDAEGKSASEIHDATHSFAFYAMAIPEELLEMTGSLLIAAAFASAVRHRRGAPQ